MVTVTHAAPAPVDVPPRAGQAIAAVGTLRERRPADAMADLISVQRVALERARHARLSPNQPRDLTRSMILDS
jgi:hypothetical protein